MNPAQLKAQHEAQAQAATDPGTETVPPHGYHAGRLNAEGRAIAAIKALGLSDTSDLLLTLQGELDQWRFCRGLRGWWRRRILRFASLPFAISREQLTAAARALSAAEIEKRAGVIREDQNTQMLKLLGDHRELRAFLYKNFPTDLDRADDLNLPLLNVAKEIMLRVKQ